MLTEMHLKVRTHPHQVPVIVIVRQGGASPERPTDLPLIYSLDSKRTVGGTVPCCLVTEGWRPRY